MLIIEMLWTYRIRFCLHFVLWLDIQWLNFLIVIFKLRKSYTNNASTELAKNGSSLRCKAAIGEEVNPQGGWGGGGGEQGAARRDGTARRLCIDRRTARRRWRRGAASAGVAALVHRLSKPRDVTARAAHTRPPPAARWARSCGTLASRCTRRRIAV